MNSDFSLKEMIDLYPPWQDLNEWQIYIEFIETYFKNREIKNPIVVEIGILKNSQKRYYEELLGYRHIGIDVKHKRRPDIVGNSRNPATVNKLKEKLEGQPINLLFIDGGHKYWQVKGDYELYAPLTKNIIVLHDMLFHKGVIKFWGELIEEDSKKPKAKIFIIISGRWHRERTVGTGIILIG